MRSLSSLVFAIAVAMSITGLAHYSVWAGLLRDVDLPALAFALLSALLVLGWLSFPLTFWLSRHSGRAARKLALAGYVWLATVFLLFVCVVSGELGWGLYALARASFGWPLPSPEGALFAARAFSALTVGLVTLLVAAALYEGRRLVALREVRVPLARLPRELDGTTIVQLSDMHIGPSLGRDFVEHVVELVNAAAPDVIAITGDLVDGAVSQLRDAVAPLARLKARHGAYFVTGNHEYYSGVDSWCTLLSELGIRVLRNERVAIGEAGASFDLAGVDDYSARAFGAGHGADLPRALEGRDPSRELVLLAHQPRAIAEAARAGVGLQLSGHTHGGQIWPFGFLVKLQQPVVAGLRRIAGTYLYVSRGTGYWGPPMRLGAPAEITRVVLLSGAESE